MKDHRVLLIDTVRTPWGKGRSMENLLSSDLAAAALLKLLKRTGVAPEAVGQVIFGQEMPSTYPNNIGHYAWLKARLPEEVPGYTVQSNTASGLQAVRNAYYLIASGNEGMCIAGGADSYSTAPFVMRDVRNHFYAKNRMALDAIEEADTCTQPEHFSSMERYRLAYGQTLSAQAKAFQDETRVRARRFSAVCGEQIAQVSYQNRKKGEIILREDGWMAEPDFETVLAPHADGAAVAMLVSDTCAERLELPAVAELIGFAVSGGDPKTLTSGVAAARELLKREDMSITDLAWAEIEESSAEDVLATAKALGIPATRINPLGGALSFGRNGAGEGLSMLMRLSTALESGQYGLLCVSSAGGQGMAALIKRI